MPKVTITTTRATIAPGLNRVKFAECCGTLATAFSRLESIMMHESDGDELTAAAILADIQVGVPMLTVLVEYGLLDG